MKNGLLFVLLMAVLVAMAVPAGAVAPTIGDLPAVVIGDKEDIDVATNAVLLRYVNVVDLNAITNEPNSGDPTKLKFWYETTGTKLKIGTPIMKAALTPAEVTALKANNPTMPPTAKELTGGTAFWMSLIQDAPAVNKVSATSVAAATAALNGATPAELTAAGATGKHSVTLYAIDDALTSKSVGSKQFDVYSRTGGFTDQFSQGGYTAVIVKDYKFDGTADGWVWLSMAGVTGYIPGVQAQTATAIGHTAASGTSAQYSSWVSPVYSIPAVNMASSYFVGTMSMSGTGASAAAAPGFRLVYADGYYLHLGGMQVMTPTGVTAFNAPWTGNNTTLKLAWAVPSDLNEYSDSGKMNGVFTAGTDLRAYSLLFDLSKSDFTDAGNVMLESALIQKVSRPASVTPTREWGGTGTAFNAPSIGWSSSASAPTADFDNGTAAVTATNMTLALSGSSTGGWASLFPNSALDATRPAWTTGKVLRTTYKIASSDANLVPNFRMLTLPTYKVPVSGTSLGTVFFGDAFNYSGPYSAGKATPALSPNGLPGAPKVAGSVIELYHGGQKAGTGAEDAILTPQCDLDLAKGTVFPANGWARPTATLTISSVKMEVLDQATTMP